MKWLGAILVIAGCGSCGLMMEANDRKEEKTLRQLFWALEWLAGELSYRMWPLPILFRQVSEQSKGMISDIFRDFAEELDRKVTPDASGCMDDVLILYPLLPEKGKQILSGLGRSMGRFDLEGQLCQIVNWKNEAQAALERHCDGRDQRLRCYRTVGICAGLALAILLF